MLEVEDILPSHLTPLVLPHPVPEPECKMQTPSPSRQQSSPQPPSGNTANYAWVNPLPSPATSSSGELHLYIDSDTSSPSIHVGPLCSSQEPLLQADHTVSHPHHSSQLPPQRLVQHYRTLSFQPFLPELMKWPQRKIQATPHQRR